MRAMVVQKPTRTSPQLDFKAFCHALTGQSQNLSFPDFKADVIDCLYLWRRPTHKGIGEAAPGIEVFHQPGHFDDIPIPMMFVFVAQMTPFFTQVAYCA